MFVNDGENIFFLHPFLECSFPAWWSELMRVWPPSSLNLCALKCKDVGKRRSSDSTHQGMPENQRAWVITSKKDRSGLWNLILYKQSMTLISTLSAFPDSAAPKVTCHKQILSWFFLYLCFHQIKMWHLHCQCSSFFWDQIMYCHQGLSWEQRAGTSCKAWCASKVKSFSTGNLFVIQSFQLLEGWKKTWPWSGPLLNIQALKCQLEKLV